MKLYKPYESLFCSIESFYTLTGVGGFYKNVAGLIATLQWFNILLIGSIITLVLEFRIRLIFYIVIYSILFILNLIYFKDKKVHDLLSKYEELNRKKKIFNGTSAIIYILASFVLLIISFNCK